MKKWYVVFDLLTDFNLATVINEFFNFSLTQLLVNKPFFCKFAFYDKPAENEELWIQLDTKESRARISLKRYARNKLTSTQKRREHLYDLTRPLNYKVLSHVAFLSNIYISLTVINPNVGKCHLSLMLAAKIRGYLLFSNYQERIRDGNKWSAKICDRLLKSPQIFCVETKKKVKKIMRIGNINGLVNLLMSHVCTVGWSVKRAMTWKETRDPATSDKQEKTRRARTSYFSRPREGIDLYTKFLHSSLSADASFRSFSFFSMPLKKVACPNFPWPKSSKDDCERESKLFRYTGCPEIFENLECPQIDISWDPSLRISVSRLFCSTHIDTRQTSRAKTLKQIVFAYALNAATENKSDQHFRQVQKC